MRHTILGIGLFLVSSVISTVAWFATEPDLSLNQPFFAATPSREVASKEATYIKQMQASLNEDASEPPVEDRGLLLNASYVDTYGVNEEFIKRACYEMRQRTP